MDADWYEDPLGRFDGRFFDGEKWTAEVSAAGSLIVDPDFGNTDAADPAAPFTVENPAPAVEQLVRPRRSDLATTSAESPARVVAVLDESIRPAPEIPEPEPDTRPEPDPGSGTARSTSNSLWRWLLAALVVVAAAVVVAILISGDDGAVVDAPIALDDDQEARVEDLVEGGLDSGIGPGDVQELEEAPAATQTDAPPAPAAESETNDLEVDQPVELANVLNADTVIAELNEWHLSFADDQGVTLGPDAGCWFGEIEGALDSSIYCGPVFDDGVELLFNAIPVRFEDALGGKISDPLIGAVETDVPLSPGVTLLESDSSPAPPLSLSSPQRGGRNSGD